MTDQSIPPIAAGTWQVNLGGVEATFNLTQYVGYVAGTVTEGGRTGRFEQVHVADRHADTPSLAAGLWFGGAFTISDWSDGGPTTSGYAEGSTQSSGYMSVFLTNSLGQNVYVGTATRINGDNWTP